MRTGRRKWTEVRASPFSERTRAHKGGPSPLPVPPLPLYPMHYPRGTHFASFHLLWLMPLTHSLFRSLLMPCLSQTLPLSSLDQKQSHLPLTPPLLHPPCLECLQFFPLPAAPADIVAGSEAEPSAPAAAAAAAAPAEEEAEAPALVWSRQLLARIRDKVGWSDALTWLQVCGGGIVGRRGGGTIAAIHF